MNQICRCTAAFLILMPASSFISPGQTGRKTGYIEVCLETLADRAVQGRYGFTLGADATVYEAQAGYCTFPIESAAGEVEVHALPETGTTVTAIATQPANRLIRFDLRKEKATIRIVAGDISTQSVVVFTRVQGAQPAVATGSSAAALPVVGPPD